MTGMHMDDVVLRRDETWHGMVMGDLVVSAGCRVSVHGMVSGDVIVDEDAEAVIHAMVGGKVVERGGRAVLKGLVGG
ncbi:hypothetical protein [Sphingomonas bacterium]|uniref:hypothetical protein n=1 Tax=Sphingomonas bacterium TaxID=1895847 RepID=UPI0015777AA6|nr:hypothetical protein [Sphingomonas bacterium]